MGRKRQSNRGEKSASDNTAHAPVGYGQPPLASRFKPGTSGNAKGRPKGSKNFKTLIKQAMTASISIQEGQTSRRVSKIEGVVLRQLQSALKGNERSAMAAIKMAMLVGHLRQLLQRTRHKTRDRFSRRHELRLVSPRFPQNEGQS